MNNLNHLEDFARERYGLMRTGDELLLLAKGEELLAAAKGGLKELNPHFGGDLNANDLEALVRMHEEDDKFLTVWKGLAREVVKFLSSSGYKTLGEADVPSEWFVELLDKCAAKQGLKRV